MAKGVERASLGANAADKDHFALIYPAGPLFDAPMPNFLNSEQLGIIERLATRSYHRFGIGRLLMALSCQFEMSANPFGIEGKADPGNSLVKIIWNQGPKTRRCSSCQTSDLE